MGTSRNAHGTTLRARCRATRGARIAARGPRPAISRSGPVSDHRSRAVPEPATPAAARPDRLLPNGGMDCGPGGRRQGIVVVSDDGGDRGPRRAVHPLEGDGHGPEGPLSRMRRGRGDPVRVVGTYAGSADIMENGVVSVVVGEDEDYESSCEEEENMLRRPCSGCGEPVDQRGGARTLCLVRKDSLLCSKCCKPVDARNAHVRRRKRSCEDVVKEESDTNCKVNSPFKKTRHH